MTEDDRQMLEQLRVRVASESGERMLGYFTFSHLPGELAEVSSIYARAAVETVLQLRSGPERTVALRKLLEAKDRRRQGSARRHRVTDQQQLFFEEFVRRGRRAQAVVDHLAVHGPGLTFAELAIGERFRWAPPLLDVARAGRVVTLPGGEPLEKTSATAYAWSRGTGTAEDYYRVERVRTRSEEDGS